MGEREMAGAPGRVLESVWDYPLPPRIERTTSHAQVIVNGFLIADSVDLHRVLQTGLPPSYYFPPEDVQAVYLRPNGRHSTCAYRGRASYYDVVVGDREIVDGAWTYHDPNAEYALLADRVSFYPARMDACLLDGEPARVDVAEDTGGWVTSAIQGLSKGYPRGWDRSEDT